MAVVKVVCKNLKNNPCCPHGPTLKYVRVHNGSQQKFFACSTYRDRKDCGFYLAAGDRLSERIAELWILETQRVLPSVNHAEMEVRLNEVKQVPPKDRLYCHTCGQLDLMFRREQHRAHDVQTVISDKMLSHPSQILKPKEGSKKEAQYFFTASTAQVIVNNLQCAGVSRVLCLGTPRIHEHIQAGGGEMESLLLDLDHRHHSFWPADKFIWYNMFNRHMLSGQQEVPKHDLQKFLTASGQMALVMDPPFGGHVEPLTATINHFTKLVAKINQDNELQVIWVFPYFRERHITEKCPLLVMLDYKVEYDNHKEFNNGTKGRKFGSPVRLFTNMDPRQFILPKSEGYRNCNLCHRWVSAQNKHCRKCNSCPTKDGQTYIHCDPCGSCIKPQWRHCATCQKCLPSVHHCYSEVMETLRDKNTKPRRKRTNKIKQESSSTSRQKRKKI